MIFSILTDYHVKNLFIFSGRIDKIVSNLFLTNRNFRISPKKQPPPAFCRKSACFFICMNIFPFYEKTKGRAGGVCPAAGLFCRNVALRNGPAQVPMEQVLVKLTSGGTNSSGGRDFLRRRA
ncbi:MAG: hypothetical protein ACI3XU_00200, partial [Butyricicoccaceae bacterium]